MRGWVEGKPIIVLKKNVRTRNLNLVVHQSWTHLLHPRTFNGPRVGGRVGCRQGLRSQRVGGLAVCERDVALHRQRELLLWRAPSVLVRVTVVGHAPRMTGTLPHTCCTQVWVSF